jgi:recombination protein RecA
MGAAWAVIESLLRDRKLDVTLTSGRPWQETADVAATGVEAVDKALGGGLRRGHLSEIVGPRSSGRTSVLCSVLAAATSRGEVVALVDSCDRFDPSSAADAGVDLSRLLWIREAGDAARALKAMNLVLQAGGFGVVGFDLADVTPMAIRQFPYTTWMRIARVIEGSQSVAMLVGADRIARSPGGVTIALDAGPAAARGTWQGAADRARFLRGVDIQPRIVSAFAKAPTCAEAPAYAEAPAGKPARKPAGRPADKSAR